MKYNEMPNGTFEIFNSHFGRLLIIYNFIIIILFTNYYHMIVPNNIIYYIRFVICAVY